jgi:hypothetical protein
MCEVEGEKAGFLFIYNNLFVYEGDLLTEQNAMFPLRVNELSLLLWNYGRDIVWKRDSIFKKKLFLFKIIFFIFLNCFNMLMSKIILKKYIVLIYFYAKYFYKICSITGYSVKSSYI